MEETQEVAKKKNCMKFLQPPKLQTPLSARSVLPLLTALLLLHSHYGDGSVRGGGSRLGSAVGHGGWFVGIVCLA